MTRGLDIPQLQGRGCLSFLQPLDGLSIVIGDFCTDDEFEIRVEPHKVLGDSQPTIVFGFILAGHGSIKIDGSDQLISMAANQVGVWPTGAGAAHVTRYKSGETIKFVAVRVSQCVAELFGNEGDDPLDTRPLAWCGTEPRTASLNPEILIAIHQFLSAPSLGRSSGLFARSKSLELIALSLGLFETTKQRDDGAPYSTARPLRRQDAERIRAARDMLVARMEYPPSLAELARAVGVNLQKLKSGFRELYGTTAFSYLQQQRLETARTMLEEGELTVSEVALAVGCNHFGYFAASFRKRYGVPPGALRRHAKQRSERVT